MESVEEPENDIAIGVGARPEPDSDRKLNDEKKVGDGAGTVDAEGDDTRDASSAGVADSKSPSSKRGSSRMSSSRSQSKEPQGPPSRRQSRNGGPSRQASVDADSSRAPDSDEAAALDSFAEQFSAAVTLGDTGQLGGDPLPEMKQDVAPPSPSQSQAVHEETAAAVAAADVPEWVVQELRDKQHVIDRLMEESTARSEALRRCGLQLAQARQQAKQATSRANKLEKTLRRGQEADTIQMQRLLATFDERIPLEEVPSRQLCEFVRALARQLDDREREKHDLEQAARAGHEARGKFDALASEHQQLQSAHRAQALHMQKLQRKQAKVDAYRNTITAQERVIAKMQRLIEGRLKRGEMSMTDGAPAPSARSPRVDDVNTTDVPDYNLRDALKDARMENTQLEEDLQALRQELEQAREAAQKAEDLQERYNSVALSSQAKDRRIETLEEELVKQAQESAKELSDMKLRMLIMQNAAPPTYSDSPVHSQASHDSPQALFVPGRGIPPAATEPDGASNAHEQVRPATGGNPPPSAGSEIGRKSRPSTGGTTSARDPSRPATGGSGRTPSSRSSHGAPSRDGSRKSSRRDSRPGSQRLESLAPVLGTESPSLSRPASGQLPEVGEDAGKKSEASDDAAHEEERGEASGDAEHDQAREADGHGEHDEQAGADDHKADDDAKPLDSGEA